MIEVLAAVTGVLAAVSLWSYRRSPNASERIMRAWLAPWTTFLVVAFLVLVVWGVLGVDPNRALFWILVLPFAVPLLTADAFNQVRSLRGTDVAAERRRVASATAAEMWRRRKDRS